VAMNMVRRSNVHWRITVVFDWKTAAVVGLSIVTLLLLWKK
jgi:hypothetical protein